MLGKVKLFSDQFGLVLHQQESHLEVQSKLQLIVIMFDLIIDIEVIRFQFSHIYINYVLSQKLTVIK